MAKCFLLFLLFLSSCAKVRSPSQSSGSWHSPLAEGVVTSSPGCFAWWKALNDPLLNDLMRRAALNNFDMLIARETKRQDCATWRSLSADVAKSYAELRGLQLRLDLLTKNINAQQDTVKLTQSLIASGFVGLIDQIQAEEVLSQFLGQKSQIELAIQKTMHHLSLLMGRSPGNLPCELAQRAELPALPCQMPIGTPCDFLARRDDVYLAGRCMASAGKGKASFAYYLYEKAALVALEEAENSLSTLYYAIENHRDMKEAYEKGVQAYEQIYQLYSRGLKSYLEVLVIQQAHITSTEAYVQSRIQLINAYITLYQVLVVKKATV